VKTTRSLLTLALSAALVLSACGGSDSASDTTVAVTNPTINVGHTAEPISELLAEVYGQALETAGFRVGRKDASADRAATNAGLESGSLQLVPEESGPLLASLGAESPSGDTTPTGDTTATGDTTGDTVDESVLLPGELQVAAMNDALPNSLTVNGAALAVTTPTVACTPAAVEAHSLTDLSSLAAAAADVQLGVPADFDIETLAEAYGAAFTTTAVDEQDAADAVAADTDCLIVPAVSPVIISAGLLALDDDLQAIPVSVVAPVAAVSVSTPEMINVLAQVNNALTTDVLRALLVKAQDGSVSYDLVAKQFLATFSNGQ
jgi:osmoprotectant transport system substrate-binding protein